MSDRQKLIVTAFGLGLGLGVALTIISYVGDLSLGWTLVIATVVAVPVGVVGGRRLRR